MPVHHCVKHYGNVMMLRRCRAFLGYMGVAVHAEVLWHMCCLTQGAQSFLLIDGQFLAWIVKASGHKLNEVPIGG